LDVGTWIFSGAWKLALGALNIFISILRLIRVNQCPSVVKKDCLNLKALKVALETSQLKPETSRT
jgi:hypothetical protein